MSEHITQQDLRASLTQSGLKEGDSVLVHSDLRVFGMPKDATNREDILKFYYQGFKDILGIQGTLAVPAYFYEYARYGEPFDTETSPVSASLGVFSSYVTSLPHRIRSCNPLQSIAAIGVHAEFLCGSNSLSGYGVTAPWHRLRELKGKMLFLGTTIQPMTFVHYIEQQYGVPHLYFKIYPYPVTRNGQPIQGRPISAVRFLDYGIEYDLKAFQAELEKKGVLRTAALGRSRLLVVDAEAAFLTGIEMLDKNPYAFLKKAPEFVPGKIPTDGVTGKK